MSFQTPVNELLIFDLDGTLLNEKHQIPEGLRSMLHALRQSGIEMTLATGRPFAAVKHFIDELDLTLPLITFNGAVVSSPRGGLLSVHPLPFDAAKAVLARLGKTTAANHLYLNPTDNYFYTDHAWKSTDHLMQKDGLGYKHSPTLFDVLRETAADPVKMFSIGPRNELEDVQQWARETESTVSCFFSEHDMIEFLAPGITKGTALEFLCESLNRPPESVIAFGDNMNDLEMLQIAGTGVAMAKAPAELQQVADHVTRSIEAFLTQRFNGI